MPFAIAHTALVVAVKRDSAAHRCVTSLGGGGGEPGRAAPRVHSMLATLPRRRVVYRGLHSSTSQLNLSRFLHKDTS
jgi:hypothetical protein